MTETQKPMHLKAKAASSAIWNTIEAVGIQGISLVVFIVMAHFVGPHDFGLISLSYLVVQSLQAILLFNIAVAAVRKSVPSNSDYTTTFWLSLMLTSITALGVFASAPFLEKILNAEGLAAVIRPMSIILVFMGLSRTHEAWLLRNFQSKSMAIRGVFGAVAGGAVGIALASKGWGIQALIAQQVTTSLVSLILLWIVTPWKPSFTFSRNSAKEILMVLGQMAPNTVMYALNMNCDVVLVSWLNGATAAGFFSVAKRLRLAMQLAIADPIKPVTFSTLAEIQDDMERFNRGIIKIIRLLCVIALPTFVGVSLLSSELIVTVFGSKWAPAGPSLAILSLGGMAIILVSFCDNVFVIKRKPIWSFYISCLHVALTIISAIYLKQTTTNLPIALAFVLPYLITLPVILLLLCRVSGLSLRKLSQVLLPTFLSVAVMAIIVFTANISIHDISSLNRLIVLSLIGIASYVLVLYSIARAELMEVLDVISHLTTRMRA